MRKVLIFSLVVGICLFMSKKEIFAQTKDELQKKKEQTEETIKLTNELLEKTERSKSSGLNKLLIISKRISLRQQLIEEMAIEINLLERNIVEKNTEITHLENEIVRLKDEYAKMIYYAYKNRNSYDKLMFILAAEDFNQAYRRMKYFQQYSEYRKKQAKKIVVTQKNLEYEVEQLKEAREEKISLLSRKERENQQLTAEKGKKTTEINRLKRKERELRRKIKDEEKRRRQIENTIADLIAREAKGNKTYKTLSASEEVISQGFKNSKGKLKWPINRGVIIQEFGEHAHPILKGVKIKSDGVEISATSDLKVKAIYEGEIKNVFAIPGKNMAIIIRHGHYLSLYTNLTNVRAKQGDIVREGFYIGDIYNSTRGEGSTLQLGIYEETKALNPKNWLKKQ
jgi:septal ring factor EnvC (AmiA/AmiB activator)